MIYKYHFKASYRLGASLGLELGWPYPTPKLSVTKKGLETNFVNVKLFRWFELFQILKMRLLVDTCFGNYGNIYVNFLHLY